eukprot:COSAG01_NODE_4779_length_4745_cov_14.712043_1_plen_58_part_10
MWYMQIVQELSVKVGHKGDPSKTDTDARPLGPTHGHTDTGARRCTGGGGGAPPPPPPH